MNQRYVVKSHKVKTRGATLTEYYIFDSKTNKSYGSNSFDKSEVESLCKWLNQSGVQSK